MGGEMVGVLSLKSRVCRLEGGIPDIGGDVERTAGVKEGGGEATGGTTGGGVVITAGGDVFEWALPTRAGVMRVVLGEIGGELAFERADDDESVLGVSLGVGGLSWGGTSSGTLLVVLLNPSALILKFSCRTPLDSCIPLRSTRGDSESDR